MFGFSSTFLSRSHCNEVFLNRQMYVFSVSQKSMKTTGGLNARIGGNDLVKGVFVEDLFWNVYFPTVLFLGAAFCL